MIVKVRGGPDVCCVSWWAWWWLVEARRNSCATHAVTDSVPHTSSCCTPLASSQTSERCVAMLQLLGQPQHAKLACCAVSWCAMPCCAHLSATRIMLSRCLPSSLGDSCRVAPLDSEEGKKRFLHRPKQ
jgi:hypothetical protein